MADRKIVITGGAGLVGQNLAHRLGRKGFDRVVAIDKHKDNAAILMRLQPSTKVVVADLADDGSWESELEGCSALVLAHAQIGGLDPAEFVRNNIQATERVLAAASRAHVPYIVHLSSSVVNSQAVDSYTETKKEQEALVDACGIKHVVLRPTLMFGWFDRKHLGWLARFMERARVFPIPGTGRFPRQPLYVGDFCDIIAASIEGRAAGTFNITGRETIDYIDLVRAVREAVGSRTRLVRIPYSVFRALLACYALINSDPPFTTKQLKALVTPDIFEVIDWPGIFGVRATGLKQALAETFRDPTFSSVILKF